MAAVLPPSLQVWEPLGTQKLGVSQGGKGWDERLAEPSGDRAQQKRRGPLEALLTGHVGLELTPGRAIHNG